MRAAVVAVVLVVLVGLLWAPAAIIGIVAAGEESRAEPVSGSCDVAPVGDYGETSVTVGSLTEQQVASAHTIWAVAHQVGVGDRGAVVGIATAMQESTLGANPATKRPNSDVDVGLFQQRALVGWYADGMSVEENVKILNDDTVAARTFFEGHKVTAKAHAAASSPAGPVGYHIPGLKQIKGWETMEVTRAAQAVQRSAYPNLYAKHEGLGRQLVAAFNAEAGGDRPAPVAAPVLCDPPAGPVEECEPSGLPVERGLTPDAVRVVRCVKPRFPESYAIYGVRADSLPEHPSGRAVDIMFPGTCNPAGDRAAAWLRENAASMGVMQVIWCQKIWTSLRDGEGWRAMVSKGSVTQDHKDHVHVTVAGNAARPATVASAAGGVVSPVEGYVLSARHNQAGSWWSSGRHTGLDFAGPVDGKPVRAVQSGTCNGSVWHSAYGNLLKIDHGGGVESWYAHLAGPATCSGRVGAGQVVGRVGTTGNSSGPHLHLEIRKGGSPVDPDAWLAANGVVLNGSRAGSRS